MVCEGSPFVTKKHTGEETIIREVEEGKDGLGKIGYKDILDCTGGVDVPSYNRVRVDGAVAEAGKGGEGERLWECFDAKTEED